MALVRHQVIDQQTAFASATRTVDFTPHSAANYVKFYWNISATGGTTPGPSDLSLSYIDPTSGVVVALDEGAFAQIANTGHALLVVHPALASDVAGIPRNARSLLPGQMRASFTFSRTDGNETYTYTLTADWYTGT